MKNDPIFKELDSEEGSEAILKSYQRYRNKPMRILFSLYKGNVGKILLSSFFFIIKNSPLWIIPIVTANIVHIATHAKNFSVHSLWVNIFVAVFFIVIHDGRLVESGTYAELITLQGEFYRMNRLQSDPDCIVPF